MSGGERKKKILGPGVKGWEEAGGEFYQECYPGAEVDLEVMKNDPHCISTLLPSKKNRTGTVTMNKKDTKLTTLRYRSSIRSRYQTAVGPNNDVQISFMPDLSENLSNEELLWEEIMKIKAMPVNMAQKKEMKAKLQSKDTLRLQGFKQFRWKRRQTWMHLKVRLKELNKKLTLWRSSLKKIEGYHGTGVMSFFLFLKWLIFLNVIISLIIYIFVIYPMVLIKEEKFVVNDTQIKISCTNSMNSTDPLFQFFIGKGWLNRIPLYYDYYENESLDLYYFNYDLPLAYILATFLYFLYSFLVILKNAANGFKHKLMENEGQFYIYCNIIFSGWDFCIRNETSAKIKHKALYNEITGRLNMERRKEEQRNRTRDESFRLFFIRIIVNVFVLALLSVAGIVIFLSFNYFTQLSTDNQVLQLVVEFAPASFIVTCNIILPIIFHWLGSLENFSPLFTIQVAVFRTILLRYSSLCVLLASFYQTTSSDEKRLDCWENIVAQELYKLLMLSVATNILVTFVFNFPRSFIAAHTSNKFFQLLGKQEFHLPTHVLDVVYIQTIIWLGSFYAPLLPTLGVVIFFILFYVKKFACLVNCDAATKVYYASRSHSLYMFILLFSFAFSAIPWAFSITEITPSKMHGPFQTYDTVWMVIQKTFENFPLWLQHAILFCTRSTFIVPLFILLSLANYYYYAVYTANKQMVIVLKRQLVLEGHDKQFLLNRLSAFIRQQQRYYKPINTEI